MAKNREPTCTDKYTDAVLRGEAPAGPPAAGSAGIPWGGAGAVEAWSDDKSEYSAEKPASPSPQS